MTDSLSITVHAFASRMVFLGWLDTISEVGELVHWFQRLTL